MIQPIKVGVIGLGKIAQIMHLHFLRQLETFQLVAISDLSSVLLERIGTEYGVDERKRYKDYRDLLQEPLDAVFVLNTNHAPVVLAALAAHKHIFVEKPLCWSPREAEAISQAMQEHPAVVQVGYMKRYDPGFLAGQRLLNDLGTVHLARMHNFAGGWQRQQPIYPVYRPTDLLLNSRMLMDQELTPVMEEALESAEPHVIQIYRALMELCSHDLNLLRTLFGPVIQVDFAYARFLPQQLVFTASLRFQQDVQCLWEVSPRFSALLDWDEHITAYTSEAQLTIRFANPFIRHLPTRVRIRGGEQMILSEKDVLASYESPFKLELESFAQCIREGRAPLTSIDDAREDIEQFIQIVKQTRIEK